ncbi:MAG: c-type cytochrome [Deltaproteobacteria bacterium]|nr:c-type cytochrome [Deltaproteobacteria bacterium]
MAAAGLAACGGSEETPPPAPPPVADDSEARALAARAAGALGALPASAATPDRPMPPARVDLGRMLYYDLRLSKNHDIACNSCHPLSGFGADGEATSPGHQGQRGDRNSPTSLNAALHIAQFWDGRAADVEEQAKGPILNPVEMAMPSEAAVVAMLKSIPDYPGLFAAAFPDSADDAVTYDHMATAIGAFERGLVTPGPFDDFLGGDYAALSPDAQKGLELFLDVGCIACHVGPAVGGGMYQKLGLIEPYETEDTGRHKVTGNDADKFFFKVPSLRNVAETGPYLHDGSVADLGEMVRIMGRHQLGKNLDAEQVRLLVRFLEGLTGRVDKGYVAQPTLPASGGDTPGPSTS